MPDSTETATDTMPTAEEAAAGLAMMNEKLGLTEEEPAEVEETVAAEGEDTVEGEGGGDEAPSETPEADSEGAEAHSSQEDAEETVEETAEAGDDKPIPVPAKKPAAETTAAEGVQKKDLRAERKRINTRITDLRHQLKAKKDAKTFDAIEDADLLAEIADASLEAAQIQEEVATEIDAEMEPRKREEAAEAFWEQWNDPDIDADTAFKAWEDSMEAAQKKNKSEEAIRAVATDRFEQKLEQIRAGKKAAADTKAKEAEKKNAPVPKVPARNIPQPNKAALNKPPVNKGAGGGQVVPAGGGPVVRTKQAEPVASEELKQRFLNL